MQKKKWVRAGLATVIVAGAFGGMSVAGCSGDDNTPAQKTDSGTKNDSSIPSGDSSTAGDTGTHPTDSSTTGDGEGGTRHAERQGVHRQRGDEPARSALSASASASRPPPTAAARSPWPAASRRSPTTSSPASRSRVSPRASAAPRRARPAQGVRPLDADDCALRDQRRGPGPDRTRRTAVRTAAPRCPARGSSEPTRSARAARVVEPSRSARTTGTSARSPRARWHTVRLGSPPSPAARRASRTRRVRRRRTTCCCNSAKQPPTTWRRAT